MRDLITVIEQMLAIIPYDEFVLRHKLLSLRETAFYAAPEAMSLQWTKAAYILNSYANCGYEWEARLKEVFSGSS